MPTPTETATSTTAAFTAAWQEWRAAGDERHRADPHGFLAVTHLHWLGHSHRPGGAAAPLDGVPGTWSVENDVVTVVLGAGESLLRDGHELNHEGVGTTVTFGPIAERDGLNLKSGDAVVELRQARRRVHRPAAAPGEHAAQ